MVQGKYAEQIGDVLRRDFGVLTVSVQAKKGLVTKKDRRAFSSALQTEVSDEPPVGSPRGRPP